MLIEYTRGEDMDTIKLNSVEDLRNCGPGTYLVPYGKYEFIVALGTIDQNASINLDGYGIGAVKDAGMLGSYLDSSDNSIDVVIRTRGGGNAYDTGNWNKAAGNFMYDLSRTLNVSQDNSMLMGFSLSAERTVPFAADYAASNNASHFATVIVESSCTPQTRLSNSQRQSLIDHDVTVLNVYQANRTSRSLLSPLHLQNYEL